MVEAPVHATQPPIETSLASSQTTFAPDDSAALEDSGIDTAKLPKLEAPDEPTAQIDAAPMLDAPVLDVPVRDARVMAAASSEDAASHPAEVPPAATEPAPASEPTSAPPPARVVWSSGPAAPTQDRSRED